MKNLLVFITILFAFDKSKAQTLAALDVADITLKIGAKSEESLYYGFAEGDQIVFNFKELDENGGVR